MALRPSNDKSPADKASVRAAAEQEVLMREVDEAVRQDQMSNVAKKYGVAALVAIVLLLGAFAGFLYWRSHNEGQFEQRSENLISALDQLDAGRASQADKELAAIVEDDPSGAGVPAKLLRASIALGDGKAQQAIALYDEVAADDDAPQPYRDLAAIRSVAAGYDNMKPQQVIDRLKPLAEPGNPWFGSAGELVGMAYLEQNKPELAGPLFASIAKDDKVPETLRSRARQLAGLLGYDAIVDVDKALADLGQSGASAAPAQ